LRKEIKMPHVITEYDIERTKALARIMVRKWEPGLINFDDVLGDGLEGLTRAAQKYDETLGKHFWAYATPVVRGYMLNGFRSRFGDKRQKLELARAESLSIPEDDEDDYKPWMQIPVEENWETGRILVDKIEKSNLGPLQKRIMRLLAGGYTQADIARLLNASDGNISRSIQAIRERFSQEELREIIVH
jgi:RNA polymerase sigma factor (sigma-70 family)